MQVGRAIHRSMHWCGGATVQEAPSLTAAQCDVGTIELPNRIAQSYHVFRTGGRGASFLTVVTCFFWVLLGPSANQYRKVSMGIRFVHLLCSSRSGQ